MNRPLLYLPPYFGAMTDGNLVKCYTPGRELRRVFNSWEDYFAFVQSETLKKEAEHRAIISREEEVRKTLSSFKLELRL